MEQLDKIIFGDNQFFGINHRSQEKAEEMLKRFETLDNIFEVYDNAFDCGIKGVMLNSNEKAEPICERFRANKSRYGDISWYPSIPYAYKYANMVNEMGIFPAVNEVLFKGNTSGSVLGMIGKGANFIFTRDAMKIMEMLVDVEYKMFRGLNVKVFFLQNIVTDLMLGYGIREVFEHFAGYIRKKYGVTPGFVTLNMPYLKKKFEEWGLEEVVICSSVNAAGFHMHPSKEEYEKVIAANDPSRYQLMAMNVLASGSIGVQQSFDYINRQNIQSVVFGASSRAHIQSTVDAIHLK